MASLVTYNSQNSSYLGYRFGSNKRNLVPVSEEFESRVSRIEVTEKSKKWFQLAVSSCYPSSRIYWGFDSIF